jgi:type II secretory pathway pseudopilin PulG
MRKIVLTVMGALLITVSTAQIASATQIHRARKVQAATSQQFRNARNSVAAPATSSELEIYSRGWSAPAGQ